MRRKNKSKTSRIRHTPPIKPAELPTVVQNNSATPTISSDKEATKPVRYVWPTSLRGRRFALRLSIIGLVIVTLIGFIYIVFGPFASGIASTIIGIIGGIIVNTIERDQGVDYKLAIPWTPNSWLGIAFLSIILFQVIDLLIRLWLLPWRIAYGPSFNTSPVAITGIIIFDFGGLILCGVLIGHLMPTRALTAAIIGASLYTGMGLVEAYTGVANYSNYAFIASYMNLDTDAESYQSFRLGLVFGLILRGILAVVIAKHVARRRIRKGLVYQ